jgi:hypothetical protein
MNEITTQSLWTETMKVRVACIMCALTLSLPNREREFLISDGECIQQRLNI